MGRLLLPSRCSRVFPAPTLCPLTARCTSRRTPSFWTGTRVTLSTSETPGGALNSVPGPAATGQHLMMERTPPPTQLLHPHCHLPPTPPWLCSLNTSLYNRGEAVTLLQASRGQPLWLQHALSGAAQTGTVESGTLQLAKTTALASPHAPRNEVYRERSSCQNLCLLSSRRPHLQPLNLISTPSHLQLLTFPHLPLLSATRPCIMERWDRVIVAQTVVTEDWR